MTWGAEGSGRGCQGVVSILTVFPEGWQTLRRTSVRTPPCVRGGPFSARLLPVAPEPAGPPLGGGAGSASTRAAPSQVVLQTDLEGVSRQRSRACVNLLLVFLLTRHRAVSLVCEGSDGFLPASAQRLSEGPRGPSSRCRRERAVGGRRGFGSLASLQRRKRCCQCGPKCPVRWSWL